MLTRRDLGKLAMAGFSPQTVFAQHAAVEGAVPVNTVWLNANENPDGPPPEAKDAIARAIADAGRYNHRVFPLLNDVLAASVGLTANQAIDRAGTTHCPDHPSHVFT